MTTTIAWHHDGTTLGPFPGGRTTSPAGRAALLGTALLGTALPCTALLGTALPGAALPPKVVARRTAAWIWGLDVLPPGAARMGWELDLVDGAGLPPSHVAEEGGLRVTTPARTALDCARRLPPQEAVAALDQFLRTGVELAELKLMARDLRGRRDSSRLRGVLSLGDRGAASPGESRTRFTVVDTGFPRPRTQVPVMGPRGDPFFIDLGYEEFRVGMEYDGEPHHTGPVARARDEARRRWLTREMGWEIITVTRDFLPCPGPYLEVLLTALLHRGWEPSPTTMDRIATRLARLSRRSPRSRRRPRAPTR
ncbi:hypothetical protein GCM10023085_47750 [Actinomadura viridis]|uniref:DUF559 domain-containing protein n=1 Tax=Actinomadura viridis TaxID=58110 RepID=A0A931GKC9_9ACTN|nr:hypothetical protein [Actinomadura viridis]MBG6090723.1 hypothetical protein [Actinomadura viridis]